MIAGDPNVANVEAVASALGDLRDVLVLVGGCAASLLIDAPTAPPPRVTYDVDLAVEVASLHQYHELERKFAQLGFKRDVSADAPICRWRLGAIEVDLMPTDERVLGFSNRWYPTVVTTASDVALPSGTRIRLATAPAFIATKFEAFHTRGRSDPMTSHDLEDIVNVVEGRTAIEAEVATAPDDLRSYLADRITVLMAAPDFENALPGLVAYDALHAARVGRVRQRLSALAALRSS